MKLLGIDEAGRGPVIGPLVICGAMIDEDKEGELEKLGVKDSKLLTPQQREEIAAKLKYIVKSKIIIVPASEIDDCLKSPSSNLNWLEAKKSAAIINDLMPDKAVLDTPSPNLNAYNQYVRRLLKDELKSMVLITEHKADFNHVIVGAASILAKVTRDTELAKIQEKIEYPIGSGYMSDPITQKFLDEHHDEYEGMIRKSWQSYRNAVAKREQKGLGDF
jgi:ribonuclease HII